MYQQKLLKEKTRISMERHAVLQCHQNQAVLLYKMEHTKHLPIKSKWLFGLISNKLPSNCYHLSQM